ncbi:MAG: putative rane protein [Gaiellaceae bacterium]|nr:putative rane protein [Gaiellaceae bacterium]
MIALGGGLVVIVLVLGPWADAASDRTLTAHMLQHVALTMVAAPLVVLGSGGVLRALPRSLGRALVRLAHPLLGWAAFAAVLLGTHFSGFYDYTLEHAWAHALEHSLYLASAVWFWWPVLGRRWRGTVPYLLAAMPVQAAIGVALLTSDRPLYEHYTSLGDQHRGAALMWVLGSLVMAGALVWAAWDWLRAEERRAVAREAYGR